MFTCRFVPMMGLLFTSALKYFYVITKAQILDILTTYRTEPESELHSAARRGNVPLLRCLLEKEEWGKFANVTNSQKETPLHLVSASGSFESTQTLLDYGADSTLCDRSGMTSLHKAATAGHKQVVELVLRAQGYGSINMKDIWGWTPLQRALLNFHYQTATVLLEHGCLVNERDEKGRTALHVVASYGHVRMVSMLISKGANVNCQDSKGWTPMMLAVHGGHVQVVRDLIHKGCDVSLKNKEGMNALILCTRSVTLDKYSCAVELVTAGVTCPQITSALEDFLSSLRREGYVNNNNNNNLSLSKQKLRMDLTRLLVISTSDIPVSVVSKAESWLEEEVDTTHSQVLKLIRLAGTLSVLEMSSQELQKYEITFPCPSLKDISRCASRRYLARAHGNVVCALNSANDLPYGLKNLLILNHV